MAGFGVKLWVILQNIGQLKRHYAQSWETFVANSGVVTAFGVTDQESLQVLSAQAWAAEDDRTSSNWGRRSSPSLRRCIVQKRTA